MFGAELALWVALSLTTNASTACVAGALSCPIPIHFARGRDAITLKGRTIQNVDCCAYSFRARAGQTLTWSEAGATVRTVLTDPQGQSDGPGLPNAIVLKATGTYIFEVSPNLMAEGAFGPFTLTIAIR